MTYPFDRAMRNAFRVGGKRVLILGGTALLAVVLLATDFGLPVPHAVLLKFRASVGLIDLERIYATEWNRGKIVLDVDPTRSIEWIDVNKTDTISSGSGDNSRSMTYSGGGVVKFSDGSLRGYPYLELSSFGKEPTRLSTMER